MHLTSANSAATMCKLLQMHHPGFFDAIYVPMDYFKNGKWDTMAVLTENRDALFYNPLYVTEADEAIFVPVFDKLVRTVADIMDPTNRLSLFLKKWTDMNTTRWKSVDNDSILKKLINDKTYHIISPNYIAQVYTDCCRKFQAEGVEKVKAEIIQILTTIIKQVRIENSKFRKRFRAIMTDYTSLYPLAATPDERDLYVTKMLHSVFVANCEFANLLLDLHVYTIHPIILNEIDIYLPLDNILYYDPKHKSNNNRKLHVV